VGPFEGREDPLGPLAELVLDEVNVKSLRFTEDASALVSYGLKPDLRLLGPKYGVLAPKIKGAVAAMDAAAAAGSLQAGQALAVTIDGETMQLLPEEIAVETRPRAGYQVSGEGDYLVGVDLTLTQELLSEGLARELVRRIQNLRKEADFRIEDKILVYYRGDPGLAEVMRSHRPYISRETLSLEMTEGEGPAGSHSGTFEIEGESITLHLLTANGDA